jgi:CheY-like chemotaxis protein
LARRILLADDSVTAQNMGRRILTDAGYEVVTVNNGSAALKKIAELKPDLIVLDVYMPGYGGLEVCQRVKENPETRPIPVLLTVGKLEPFKAEEARRVGADAFIIKPFEATELLTVLTKLEDKIVAQSQPQKSGRFAKALAAVQQSDTGDRFGDKETGWKNRLTIPTPGAKPKPEEEAPEIVAATSVGSEPRGLEQRPEQRSEQRPEQPEAIKPVEAPQGFERPIPAGLPVDITPEEIAAITAAAASFGVKAEQVSAIPESPTQDAALNHAVQSGDVVSQEATASQRIEAETSAAPDASAPQTSHEVQVAAPAEAVSAADIGAQAARAEDHQAEDRRTEDRQTEDRQAEDRQAEDRQAEDRQAEARVTEARAEDTELPAAVVNAETTVTSELQISVPAQPAPGDAEVMAAIASLAPTNGHGIESFQSGGDGSNGAGHGVPASAVAAEILSGPRWVAEPVEVGLEESKVALDQSFDRSRERICRHRGY